MNRQHDGFRHWDQCKTPALVAARALDPEYYDLGLWRERGTMEVIMEVFEKIMQVDTA